MFEEKFTNFNVNLNTLSRTNTFSNGDLITGHISFDLSKETEITSLTMKLKGNVNVHWSIAGGGGRKSRRRRKNYSAKVELFSFKSVILQENCAVGGTPKLQPGRHVYPISCQLPRGDFPSSFRGVHGQILYTLTVGINRPWHLSKDFVTELNFVHHIDTNQPELWAPLSGSNRMTLSCLWWAPGPITMTVSTEKKAFIPGETAKIICEFSNASSRTATPKVKLQQKQTFYTANRVHRRMVSRVLANITGDRVHAHTSNVHTEIMLTIPSSASFTVSNCSFIDVDYNIEVSLCVKASHDLTVLCPIILCDTSAHALSPPLL
ncbi:arrestin domain-containing protein 3-like isoform X1 [Leuresthes tenuis]|uniref:arrestin domain-containing protein 3-like isoform X1 n=1 Tax=Leuresthes tenuis TaxID=355514 RepID=UPI003B50FFCA